MGAGRGKLSCLAWLLVNHGEAIEADLWPAVDLLELYREDSPLTLRRAWVLISGRMMVEAADGIMPLHGTALRRSIQGELGDWSRLDLLVANALDVKPPRDKAEVEWHRMQQERIKRKRAEREAAKAQQSSSCQEPSSTTQGS